MHNQVNYLYFDNCQGYASANLPPLGSITILGVTTQPSQVLLNGAAASNKYDSTSQVLEVDSINIAMDNEFTLTWK